MPVLDWLRAPIYRTFSRDELDTDTAGSAIKSSLHSTRGAYFPQVGGLPHTHKQLPTHRLDRQRSATAQILLLRYQFHHNGSIPSPKYEKTPAKWSDKKQLGDRVDPYQLMTGDVATWDNRTA
ncbi:hypothetical protein ABZW96_36975, partial [Nocardia sp. NPDC004168]|uniref:hypothetical protein n=1 Tax=Nocardia sp. NPDC004168 TaxID=3154452 RepID=UPI0033B442D6